MKLGYFDFNPDYSIRPDDLALALEERGYDSLWLGEHINIPISRRTPYPLGGELPKYYSHMRDPFISLTSAAAVTKNLKLATGICLLAERDPITTAKEVATLDSLSNGRVIFGIGGGWNVEEMENHGMPFNRRWKVLRERVLAMKPSGRGTNPRFMASLSISIGSGHIPSQPKSRIRRLSWAVLNRRACSGLWTIATGGARQIPGLRTSRG